MAVLGHFNAQSDLDELSSSGLQTLADLPDNSPNSQVDAAIALIKMNVSPVIAGARVAFSPSGKGKRTNGFVCAAVAASASALMALTACGSSNGGGGTAGATTASGTGTGAGTTTGSGVGGGDCPLYVVPSGTDLMSPKVSFAKGSTQVMQIFTDYCSNSMCHGSQSSPASGLFLGTGSVTDAPTVYKNIVGTKSGELPSMPYITPSDPEQSYLMHKVDGDQCHFDDECVGKCGAQMPSMELAGIPLGDRDTVRRWIAQGALND